LEQRQVPLIVERLERCQNRVKSDVTVQVDYFVPGNANRWSGAIVGIIDGWHNRVETVIATGQL
jgi:hypothetical protein